MFVPPPFVFALRLLFGRKAVPGVMTSGPSVWKGGPRPTEERKDGGGGCRCFRSARGGCGAAAGNDGGSRARAFLKGEAGKRAGAGIVCEREIQGRGSCAAEVAGVRLRRPQLKHRQETSQPAPASFEQALRRSSEAEK